MTYRNATQAEIEALKDIHGSIYELDLSAVPSLEGEPQVIYRAMTEMERKFMARLAKAEDQNADLQIAQKLVVFPDSETFRTMSDTAYFVNSLIVKDAVEKYGLVSIAAGKKL